MTSLYTWSEANQLLNEGDRFIEFGFFDRQSDTDIYERNLPHWFQPGAALYLTFRQIDSLPAAVVERMTTELEAWLSVRQLPPLFAQAVFKHDPLIRAEIECTLSERDKREFKSLAGQLVHRSLDECHGSCVLRDQRCAQILADAMLKFNGIKYDLDRLVVMPNHVHTIAQFYTPRDLDAVGQSWMRFTARQINRLLGLKGSLWQQEPFDHIIRSPGQFIYIQDYIEANPVKAKLSPGEFLYWQRE